MKKLLNVFCYVVILAVPLHAQNEGDSVTFSATPLAYDTYDKLEDIGAYDVLDTLVKPAGYILSTGSFDYLIVLKEKNKWIAMNLNTSANLEIDSIRRVDVNGQGSKELLLMFNHRDGRYNVYGGFSEESNEVYIYDLDKKALLIYFTTYSYYELSGTTYYDSTGVKVDPYGSFYNELYQDANPDDPEQSDSLERIFYAYTETLTAETQVERYTTDCRYLLEKNKVTLDCNGEEKEMEEESEYYETRMVYLWVKDKWIIQQNK